MKKKIVLWIMAALMTCSMAACGSTSDDQDVSGSVADDNGNGGNTAAPANTVKPSEEPFDESRLSDEYLVGIDYFTGDFLEYAPTVIAKIRYDGRIEVEFDYKLANGEDYTDVRYFDLSEEQYENIEEAINLKKLYKLDPEEADPAETMDGGTSWLIIYDKDGKVYKTRTYI